MNMKDRHCFNCLGVGVIQIPTPGVVNTSDYSGLCLCKLKISDHWGHVVSLQHVCAWHSDLLAEDERFNKLALTVE